MVFMCFAWGWGKGGCGTGEGGGKEKVEVCLWSILIDVELRVSTADGRRHPIPNPITTHHPKSRNMTQQQNCNL